MNKLGFALYIITMLAAVCALVVMHQGERPGSTEIARRIRLWWRARPRSDNVWNK